MSKLPKYIEKALKDREKYQAKANTASNIIDEYAASLEMDLDGYELEGGCFLSNLLIYTEPSTAYKSTRESLISRLEEIEEKK